MVARLFPTIKLEVQFLDLLQALKQKNAADSNSRKSIPLTTSSSSLTNGRSAAHQMAAHVIASSSFDNGQNHSSNSTSPQVLNGHHPAKMIYSERSNIAKVTPPLKTLKREPKYFPNQGLK